MESSCVHIRWNFDHFGSIIRIVPAIIFGNMFI